MKESLKQTINAMMAKLKNEKQPKDNTGNKSE